MTPKTLELSDIFESAWDTISARLPELRLAKKKVEGVTTSSMRYMFEGHLGEWKIQGELEKFMDVIKPSFDNCLAKTNVKTSVILELYKDFATDEGGTMAAEIDVDGRIKQNIATPVRAVIHALARCAKRADAKLLPTRIEYSSSKGEHVKSRPKNHEPDLIFKVYDSNGKETTRILGEFKMCTTVSLAKMIKYPNSKKAKSLRNLLGQVARDMRKYKIKYGFVSTYKETILLRIEPRRSNPKQYGLYYSGIFHDDIATHLDEETNLQDFSTRFAVLFLLHKAVDDGGEGWKLNGTEIPDPKQWYSEHITANKVPARPASPFDETTSPSRSKSNRQLRSGTRLLEVLSPHKAVDTIKKGMRVLKDNYKRPKQNRDNSLSPEPMSQTTITWAKPPPKGTEHYSDMADTDDRDNSEYIDDGFDPSDDTDGAEEAHEAGPQTRNRFRMDRPEPSTPTPLGRIGMVSHS